MVIEYGNAPKIPKQIYFDFLEVNSHPPNGEMLSLIELLRHWSFDVQLWSFPFLCIGGFVKQNASFCTSGYLLLGVLVIFIWAAKPQLAGLGDEILLSYIGILVSHYKDPVMNHGMSKLFLNVAGSKSIPKGSGRSIGFFGVKPPLLGAKWRIMT